MPKEKRDHRLGKGIDALMEGDAHTKTPEVSEKTEPASTTIYAINSQNTGQHDILKACFAGAGILATGVFVGIAAGTSASAGSHALTRTLISRPKR